MVEEEWNGYTAVKFYNNIHSKAKFHARRSNNNENIRSTLSAIPSSLRFAQYRVRQCHLHSLLELSAPILLSALWSVWTNSVLAIEKLFERNPRWIHVAPIRCFSIWLKSVINGTERIEWKICFYFSMATAIALWYFLSERSFFRDF